LHFEPVGRDLSRRPVNSWPRVCFLAFSSSRTVPILHVWSWRKASRRSDHELVSEK